MIRVVLTAVTFAIVLWSCGSKTASKAVDMDPAAAKAKYGNEYSDQQLQQLVQAESAKKEGDQIFAEGESFIAKAKEFEDKAKSETAQEKKDWNIQRAEKAYEKAYKKQIEAAKSYAQCNQAAYSVSKSVGKKYSDSPEYIRVVAEEAEEAARTHFNIAAKKRKEADTTTDLKKKAQLLNEANELEFLAVDEQQRALDVYRKKIHVEEPRREEPETTEPEANNEPEVVSEGLSQTVYKIQIAASPDELPIDKLKALYKPRPGELINNEVEDGWYKYAVGRFDTYAEAQAYKDEIAVDGSFIIAYKEDEKIILPEIQEKIARGEMIAPENPVAVASTGNRASQSEVIYKIQIAATKVPVRPSRLNKMYHGQQIVSIHKARGWFKYTVGNFDTLEKAEEFKAEAGVADSFVVAFDKSGNIVPIQ